MPNVGKIFEEQIKKSVPNYALLYRLPDAAQSFGGGNYLRFSRKNPFDFILWDSQKHILYALEMKSVGGKSISFERSKEENKEIHYHQIQGLNEWNKYDGIVCGFIIEFRKMGMTIFLDIDTFNRLLEIVDKASFNIDDLISNKLPYYVIPQTKKRTRYIYDIDNFLNRK